MSIKEQAIEYAKKGLYVFPVKADKSPATLNGFKAATNDPELVARLFDNKMAAGIGWVPGKSGYVVVDVDVKDGATGKADLEDLYQKYGRFTDGATEILTPSGGSHYVFKKNGTLIDNRSIADSIDIRADNGYGILPGSPGYEHEVSSPYLDDTITMPKWIPDEQGKHRAEVAEKMIGDRNAKIPAGSRQETLFAAGMAMRARGFPEETIAHALADMNDARCQPKLNEKRMKQLVAGVMRSNMDADPNAWSLNRIRHGEGEPLNWQQVWDNEYPPAGWVPEMEGLAINGRATNLYGPAGTGKSELVLHRAARAAREGVKILWLDREMTEPDVKERLMDMHYSPEELKSLIYILYPDLPLLDKPEGGEALVALANQYEAELVVIDSLSKFVRDEEGETHTMFYLHTILPMRMAGHAFLMIDHTGKDITRKARGASQKVDNVDYYTEITRVNGVGARLTTKKQRHSFVQPDYTYRRTVDPVHYKLGSPACVFCKEPAVTRGGPRRQWVCEDHNPRYAEQPLDGV